MPLEQQQQAGKEFFVVVQHAKKVSGVSMSQVLPGQHTYFQEPKADTTGARGGGRTHGEDIFDDGMEEVAELILC
jgi:hypothetical protein